MDHSVPLPFLRETLLFLTLVGILIPLLQRLRINQVVGFLVMGVVIGPYGIGSFVDDWPWLKWVTIPRRQGVNALAELGVIFLMFLIGLELSLQRMWSLRRWVFGTGTAQVLLSALALGGLAHAFGNPPEVALVLGLVLSLSSTAVVMQLLTEERTLATPLGQGAFAILMLQDLAVVPLLIVVDLLAKDGAGDAVWAQLLTTTVVSVGVVGLILWLGRKLIAPLFRTFAQSRQSEVFMALTLLVTLSIAGATAAAGLSMALGAFLAGLLLAETEYRHEVEVTIEPFKGLLMGLFFMSVGMGIDVREVWRDPLWLAASVLGLMGIKTVITGALMRAGGLSWGQSLQGGMLMGQGGEFAFIVIGAALGADLIDARIGQFMLLVVSLSLMVTPFFARLGQRLGQRWDEAARPHRDAHSSLAVPDVGGQVIIVGHGRVGQLLGQVLDEQRVPYIAVEHNVERVALLRAQGVPIYYGNAARVDFLDKLGLERAACMVVTTDQPAAAMRVVQNARRLHPRLPIFARSHDTQHAQDLIEAGATQVVPETLEAGLLLTSHALETVGLAERDVLAIVNAAREARTPQAVAT
jgi:CPA2 family monovalent cation:H+ antiporter-2